MICPIDWENEPGKTIEISDVKPDGTFTITAFDGFTYWVNARINLPNGKTKCGFYKLKMDETIVQPIKIILDRTDKCNTEAFVKELERKSKK